MRTNAQSHWIIALTRMIMQSPVPLDLPERKPPGKKPDPDTATQFAERGWEHFLFAKFSEAEPQFRRALEKDARSVDALTGLAFLRLDSDPGAAAAFATQALEVEPGCGLAGYAMA